VSLTSADPAQKQKVLEAEDAEERLVLALELVNQEKELAYLQKKISADVEKNVSKSQREYMLREQIKSINKELGVDQDGKEELVKKYREKIEAFREHVIPANLKVMEGELSKLSSLEKHSPEYGVSRHYLEWLTSIPWGRYTTDQLSIARATEILDSDHFGLKDVKKRILEFIAVGKLKGRLEGNILCLVGPPGVG
jgi:ATP-dependent Lon protease